MSTSIMVFNPHPYHLSKTKRLFDLLGAILLTIILSPILIGISLAIFFRSGRPIIFVQKRTGKNKKPFNFYKFRTMYVGAEKDQELHLKKNQAPTPMFKIFDDPRFIGIGKWLSKTGLDELPQLLNILRGEMSFVGPRPLPLDEAKRLGKEWDFRHTVKPGVFSEWALSPKKHESLKAWKELDEKTLIKGGIFWEIRLTIKNMLKHLTLLLWDD